MTYTLYFLYEEDTKRVFYVGITGKPLQVRLAQHFASSITRVRSTGKFRWRHHTAQKLRKMRRENRVVQIEPLLHFTEEDDAFVAERKYIAWCKSVGLRLTNGTEGGDGLRGYKLNQKQIEHLRRINSGPSNPQFGKSPSVETRAKQRAALLGTRNPGLLDPAKKEIWRSRIAANHADVSGANNPMYGRSGALAPTSRKVEQRSLDEALISVFGSTREASRATGVSCQHIASCARSGLSGCGFLWRYVT